MKTIISIILCGILASPALGNIKPKVLIDMSARSIEVIDKITGLHALSIAQQLHSAKELKLLDKAMQRLTDDQAEVINQLTYLQLLAVQQLDLGMVKELWATFSDHQLKVISEDSWGLTSDEFEAMAALISYRVQLVPVVPEAEISKVFYKN